MTYTRNMTEGGEAGHLIRFALPLLAGNLIQQLYNVVDTIIVGRYLGDNALAAVGATGSITYFFYTLCNGLATGSGVIIAQYFGSGDNKRVRSAIFNSAFVTAIFGVVVSVIAALLTEPCLRLLNTPESLLPTSVGYMRIAVSGTICVAAYNWINAVMRSLGDSKTPLIFLGIASVLNVGLDLLFVIVFDLGASGAAAATVAAQGFSALFCIVWAFSRNKLMKLSKDDLHVNGREMSRCIVTGLPIAAQNGLISISMIAIQRVTNGFGETVMAAYTASMRIEQFIQQPFTSLNAAVSTFAGQNIGAGKRSRAVKGLHVGLIISSVFAVVVAAVFMAISGLLVSCFVSGEEVIALGGSALKLTSCFYLSLGVIHVTRGFLNGAGDTGYALVNGLAEVITRIGLSIILTQTALGCWGIWVTTCATWFVTAVVSLIRYKQGKWKDKCLVQSSE
jgi:putative MATE family efflux protein